MLLMAVLYHFNFFDAKHNDKTDLLLEDKKASQFVDGSHREGVPFLTKMVKE